MSSIDPPKAGPSSIECTDAAIYQGPYSASSVVVRVFSKDDRNSYLLIVQVDPPRVKTIYQSDHKADKILALQFEPNGRLLALALQSHTLGKFELQILSTMGEKIKGIPLSFRRPLPGESTEVSDTASVLAVAEDGSRIAVSRGRQVVLIRQESFERFTQDMSIDNPARVTAMCFSPLGDQLFIGGSDGSVIAYGIQNSRLTSFYTLRQISRHAPSPPVVELMYSRNGNGNSIVAVIQSSPLANPPNSRLCIWTDFNPDCYEKELENTHASDSGAVAEMKCAALWSPAPPRASTPSSDVFLNGGFMVCGDTSGGRIHFVSHDGKELIDTAFALKDTKAAGSIRKLFLSDPSMQDPELRILYRNGRIDSRRILS
ncbi:MAG: hypothetical protein AAF355_14690 [Myxococcota bacterium]